MNIVDSSGWLEYFADGPNADFFAPIIEKPDELLVPSLSLYEVFKRVLQQRDVGEALRAVTFMQQGSVVDLDSRTALSAAKISVDLGLLIADSIMLATANQHEATFWTQNSDFEELEGIRFIKRG